ncbi:serine protease inhibitor [Synechococcus sp. UW179A]|uniref:serine protease inhibitor n=1 Tax=Synechococcus sp. UW179A TaxID=2575510 RepID=UPI001FCCACAD|nr:serine protease inhibitor [Synechococcus sp. UW179A]
MTSSCLPLMSSPAPMLPRSADNRRIVISTGESAALRRLAATLFASVLVSAAFVLAPEQPQQQASICEQHHSAEACRVW